MYISKNKIFDNSNLNKILYRGVDSRGEININHNNKYYSCYFTQNNFLPFDEIFDYSSTTASQSTHIEKKEFLEIIEDLFSNENEYNVVIDNITKTIEQKCNLVFGNEFIYCPVSSGSDCDALICYLITKSQNEFKRISVGIEESGKNSDLLHSFNIDLSNTPYDYNFSEKKISYIKDIYDRKIYENINIKLRNNNGTAKSIKEIDEEVFKLISEFHKSKPHLMIVLRHMDCSKTGLGGPSFALINELKREIGESLLVISDACQLRKPINSYKSNTSVDVLYYSFSKYYQSPMFSGILAIKKNSFFSDLFDKVKANKENFDPISLWSPLKYDQYRNECNGRLESLIRILHGLKRVQNSSLEIENKLSNHKRTLAKFARKLLISQNSKYNLDSNYIDELNLQSQHGILMLRPIKYSKKIVSPRILYEYLSKLKFLDKSIMIGQPVIINSDQNSFLNYNFRISIGYRHHLLSEKELENQIITLIDFFQESLANNLIN